MSKKIQVTNLDGDKLKVMSPYFHYNRSMNFKGINTVVLHWTAGNSVSNDIKSLNRNKYGYHFLISKDGVVTQGAPLESRLSHSGNSYGPKGKGLNNYSIGVSFSMRGDESKVKGSTKFNDEQINSLVSLLLDLKLAIPTLEYVTGHHWVSPGRKIDPYTLDFDRLINKNIGGDTLSGVGYSIWKTAQSPFPKGLSNCNCVERDTSGGCVKSTGLCKGQGGYSYSERQLSTKISDISFGSDLDTE